jgi:hypothetical protein
MARIYYVKDGSYPQSFVDFGRRISLDELERRIQGHQLRYLSTLPPEFNREQPLPSPQHVVVELAMDEPPGQLLTRTGYYLLPHLSPHEAEALIFPTTSAHLRAQDLECQEDSLSHPTGAQAAAAGHAVEAR